MSSSILVGEPLLSRQPDGKVTSRIVTAFPGFNALVTLPLGSHLAQIKAFVEEVNRWLLADAQPPLSGREEKVVWNDAVAVIVEGEIGREVVQIRADPENMPAAFAADRLLQQSVSKRRIKFLNAFAQKVRAAIKRRGLLWRITPLPTSRAEMKQRISASKIAIANGDIYYYNAATGTRFLTFHEFSLLGARDHDSLRQCLDEIKHYSASVNLEGNPQVSFFGADGAFGWQAFAPHDFQRQSAEELRTAYEDLRARFRDSVAPELQEDNPENSLWRTRMFSALVAAEGGFLSEEELLGLSPEFFLQIKWCPGGRIVNGELMFDQAVRKRRNPCEDNARELLRNLPFDYREIEYVNIGRVVNSLSRRRERLGRREVYIVVLKRRSQPSETVKIIRMQKYGVREHLDEGDSEELATFKSDEYTEYLNDRRRACRFLGMNIILDIITGEIWEHYAGPGSAPEGKMIRSPYFERDYVPGIATDKVPQHKLQDAEYARRFAALLGEAAGANIIVGRRDMEGRVLFDDGDEVLIEDGGGMPDRIAVVEQMGTFRDYLQPLRDSAAAYADPVNRRLGSVPDPEEFARLYLQAFHKRFSCIQAKMRVLGAEARARYDNRPYEKNGCFAHRWECVLERLDATDPNELAAVIRQSLLVRVDCP